jgi:hypothetical protein
VVLRRTIEAVQVQLDCPNSSALNTCGQPCLGPQTLALLAVSALSSRSEIASVRRLGLLFKSFCAGMEM